MEKRKIEVSQWFQLHSIDPEDQEALCKAYTALRDIRREMWDIVDYTGNEFEEYLRIGEALYALKRFWQRM